MPSGSWVTHDNGCQPFKVIAKKNDSDLYDVRIYDNELVAKKKVPILTFEAAQVFVGKSVLNEMTENNGEYGPHLDGNSILLHLSNNLYVFIGSEIYSFRSFGKIISYHSPVGRNDVPYPHAVDEYGNMYLLIEDVVIQKNDDPMMNTDEPYYYYYDQNETIADFHSIKKFYIGKEKCTYVYYPNPEDKYKQLGKIYVVDDSRGAKRKLSKQEYVEMNNAFGLHKGFRAIEGKEMLQERSW